MKFLVASDSRILRALARRMVDQMKLDSAQLFEAATAEAAVDVVEREAPSVVISDLDLPDADAIDLMKSVHALDDDTVFGFIDTDPGQHRGVRAVKRGAAFVLTRPMGSEFLREVIGTA